MRKSILLFLVLQLIIALIPQKSFAQSLSASTSLYTEPIVRLDNRAKMLKAYLDSYDSPLAPYAETFVKEADEYHLDWKLLVAISGVESYFGQALPENSYNAWGFNIYYGNVRYFASYEDGITTVSKALREEYINNLGTDNVNAIGSMYAEDPLWSSKVQNFMNDIDSFVLDHQAHLLPLSL
jgi:hypothetical protein